ncbi:MAG: polysaccharide export protein, partial [Deltaproteobacteria bacterium]|nr:polysaccharide export protein [Deltaproteobacteria bacterium]
MTGCRRYPAMTESEILHPAPETTELEASLPDAASEEPEGVVFGLEPEEYIIGPEDVVEIKVWDHDDLTREVTVSQRGAFSFPLIGQVRAAGLTPAQLEIEIITLLADGYLVNPQVTVTVKEFKSQKIHIIGEVKTAGTFTLGGPTTVLEILAMAGGVTERAGIEVLVIRPQEGDKKGGPV